MRNSQVRRNSADYGSSCGGLDEASCDSSLVSCCSVYEDPCATLPEDVRLGTTGGEGTSEGGSESSSIAGSVSVRTSRMNVKRAATASSAAKKKTAGGGIESQKTVRAKPATTTSSASLNAPTPRSKSRTATPRNILTKTQSASRERGERDRARSREKSSARESNSSLITEVAKTPVGGNRATPAYICRSVTPSSNQASTSASSFTRTRTRALPDSLPSVLTTEINKDLAQRGGVGARGLARSDSLRSRGASSTQGSRTPASTPSEDARSKIPSLSAPRVLYATRTDAVAKTTRADKMAANGGQDNKALDTYATLPRRNRNKISISKNISEKVDNKVTRSRPGSRDASLSRAIEKRIAGAKESSLGHKSLPPYPRHRTSEKTRIYHETSAQTGLTGQDIENAMSGQPSAVTGPEVIERLHKSCQTEDDMRDNLKRLNEENDARKEENEKLKLELAVVNRHLEEERADHAFARQELDRNAQRVLAMLGTPQSEHAGNQETRLRDYYVFSNAEYVYDALVVKNSNTWEKYVYRSRIRINTQSRN